ncbi:hypothetical protein ACWEKJ_38605 [Amycolatopsis thermoflava]
MSRSTTATQAVSRRIHLVGSLPPEVAPDPYAAMRWQLDHAAPAQLTALPADRDPNWIVGYLHNLAQVPALQPILNGAFTRYDDPIAYRRTPGHRLTPQDLTLGRIAEVEAAMAARDRLAQERGHPLPPHQVSIPAPLDLSLFAFGVPAAAMGLLPRRVALAAVREALTHVPLFTAAIADEVRQIHDRWGDQVVFQIESPAICVAFDHAPRRLWPFVTCCLLRGTTSFLLALPSEAELILHLWCHGDLGNKPIANPQTLTPMVTFTNRLATAVHTAGRVMPPTHAALANAAVPPPLDPVFYRPLRQLAPAVPFIAGLIDEQHPTRTEPALQLVEQALIRPVEVVAAPCGLGRRSPERAEANMHLARKLASLDRMSGQSRSVRRHRHGGGRHADRR